MIPEEMVLATSTDRNAPRRLRTADMATAARGARAPVEMVVVTGHAESTPNAEGAAKDSGQKAGHDDGHTSHADEQGSSGESGTEPADHSDHEGHEGHEGHEDEGHEGHDH